ncbi:MAG: DUF58 domain-containing protein [Chitinispirillaceae bacterium]|nr:DUF58 domain-containing protein [Chitinispirillaceae bacterium]
MIPKELLQKVHRIEISTKKVVDSLLSGGYHSAFKGKGMEFSEVRNYVEGDDIRNIDWNVTARMGTPYVKKHIEERELTVILVVDLSASGDFGTTDRFKSEVAVELCALLAFSAIKNNDRVGLIIFSSDVELYIPPQKGRNHVLYVIREMLYFKPKYKGTDIDKALTFLNLVQRKKSVVFLISDFISPPFEKSLRVTAKRHDLIACTLKDPREIELTDCGLMELEDAESGSTFLVDTGDPQLRNYYKEIVKKRREEISSLLANNGIDEIPISTEGDYVEEIIKFFRQREKIAERM